MRICYVATDIEVPNTGIGYSGGSIHTYEVAKNLVDLGHEVHLICMKGRLEQKDTENYDGINIHRFYNHKVAVKSKSPKLKNILKPFYPLYMKHVASVLGKKITDIAKNNNCDVIYERNSSMGAGVYASKILKKSFILEVNDPIISPLSLQQASRIISTHKTMLNGRVDDKKIIETTWGANTELFNPDVEPFSVWVKHNLFAKHVILYSGSFGAWQGVYDIVNAAEIVTKEFKNVKFLMIGSGGEWQGCKNYVEKLGLSEYFIFTGNVDYAKMPQYICASEICLAPFNPIEDTLTRKYGFFYSPLKIFEYMACGKPIITTDIENVNKIIKKDYNGILIKPGDIQALADNIIYLIINKYQRNEFGANARKDAVEKYSWKKHAEMLENVFKELI